MSNQSDIPVLTDLIERGIEITMSDLGLEDIPQIDADEPFFDEPEIDVTIPTPETTVPITENRVLEQTIRRILDQHMELAMQEIKLTIQQYHDDP